GSSSEVAGVAQLGVERRAVVVHHHVAAVAQRARVEHHGVADAVDPATLVDVPDDAHVRAVHLDEGTHGGAADGGAVHQAVEAGVEGRGMPYHQVAGRIGH